MSGTRTASAMATFAYLVLTIATTAPLWAAASTPAAPPSSRERAVAIDRVTVTPLGHRMVIEQVAQGLKFPWGMDFTPDGDVLITEKYGGIRVVRAASPGSRVVIEGRPGNVLAEEDSGLLDIALDPDFATNRQVYIAFAEGTKEANRTAIWRATYDGSGLRDGRVIFRARPDKSGPSHPGGRLLFLPDRTLLLTVGDGFDYKAAAQDLGSHLGKILRLTRDGAPAPDNPFVGREGALAEIYSYGHRNVQGLALDASTRSVWMHEHGPRGGDEVNLLSAGANYGWPLVTHGIDYDGTLISDRTTATGIERAMFFWAPSIAPSGLAIYRGLGDWEGSFLVGALAARCVVRLARGKDTGLFVERERLMYGQNKRIRDVRVGPGGAVYLLTDAADGELLRLQLAKP
jgi:glucose/arabinose dehydrogenase